MNPATQKPKSTVVRTRTIKPASVQTAIAIRRTQGQTKTQIAKDLGIARNTVTSVLELSAVEQQIAEVRQGAIALGPLALRAIETDLSLPGNGNLGLRLINDIGAIGENAIDVLRRNSTRQHSAINVLVQAGSNITIGATAPVSNDTITDTVTSVNDNATVSECVPIPGMGTGEAATTPAHTSAGAAIPGGGKHPKGRGSLKQV